MAPPRGQRLHPALDPKLGGGIRAAELLAHDAGGRRDRDDQAGALSAHDRKHGAGYVERAEQRGLYLGPEVLRADLLEEPGIEVARVVDHHVDASEPFDGGLDGRLGVGGVSNVQLHGQQFVAPAHGRGNGVGVTGGSDHRMAGRQCDLGDVDAHATPGAGNEPNLLVSHAGCTSFC